MWIPLSLTIVHATQAIYLTKMDIRANVEVYSLKLLAVSQPLAGQLHIHRKTLSVNGSLIYQIQTRQYSLPSMNLTMGSMDVILALATMSSSLTD